MAGEWRDIKLGDFVTLQRGHDLTEPERRAGRVPVMGSAGQNGFHDTALVKGPGIVIGRSGGSFGKVHFCASDYWPHNTGLYVTDFKGNDPRFAYYFLKAIDFDRYNSGSAQPSLNRNFIYSIPICVPEPTEQKAIAEVLGSLDDKIELNRRMNATLEEIARTLFRSWFVDFDPVRAKSEGRQPPGLDAQTAALFPDSFEDSTLGVIPTGWRVVPLPAAFDVNPSRRITPGHVAPYLDMKNMPTRDHRADYWTDRTLGSGARFVNGDTLVARITPCLENGKTAFVDFLGKGQVGWGSTEYLVLRPKPPLPPEYAYYLARTDEFRTFAISNMTGSSGRQRVPASSFSHFFVPVPDEDLTQQFGILARSLMSKIRHNSEESRTLAALRDTLLPKLLSGEIRVDAI